MAQQEGPVMPIDWDPKGEHERRSINLSEEYHDVDNREKTEIYKLELFALKYAYNRFIMVGLLAPLYIICICICIAGWQQGGGEEEDRAGWNFVGSQFHIVHWTAVRVSDDLPCSFSSAFFFFFWLVFLGPPLLFCLREYFFYLFH